MTDPILELLRQVIAAELIALNVLAWVMADCNRKPKRVYKPGEFIPYKP